MKKHNLRPRRQSLAITSSKTIQRRKSVIAENVITKKIKTKEKGNELEQLVYQKLSEEGITLKISDGYRDVKTKKYKPTGDGGIDMILLTKKIIFLVQCKNWISSVTTGVIRDFAGAIIQFINNPQNEEKFEGKRIVGIVVANSYTETAQRTVKTINIPIILTTADKVLTEVKQKIAQIEQELITHNISPHIIIKEAQFIEINKQTVKITQGKEVNINNNE